MGGTSPGKTDDLLLGGVQLGGVNGTSAYGRLDDIGLWSRALTSDEIANVYGINQRKCSPTETSSTPVRVALGGTCSAATTCLSGNCVNGVCCDQPSCGAGVCNAAGSAGKCTLAAGTPNVGPGTCGKTPGGLVSLWGGDGVPYDGMGTRHAIWDGYRSKYAAGRFGSAFELNEPGRQWLKVVAPAAQTGDYTFDYWYRPEVNLDSSAVLGAFIMQKGPYSIGHANGWGALEVNSSGGPDRVQVPRTFLANTWYHFAYTHSAGFLSVYIDGELAIKTAVPASMFGTVDDMLLGDNGVWTATGRLDDIGLWSRALSDLDVHRIFKMGQRKCGPNEVPTELIRPRSLTVQAGSDLAVDWSGLPPPSVPEWDQMFLVAQELETTQWVSVLELNRAASGTGTMHVPWDAEPGPYEIRLRPTDEMRSEVITVQAPAEGTACDDKDPCTADDKITGGTCKGSTSAADGIACGTGPCAGTCNTGTCEPAARAPLSCILKPQLSCILSRPGGKTAVFGYTNARYSNVRVPRGVDNALTPDTKTQPEWFKGKTPAELKQPFAFAVDYADEGSVSWTLAGETVTTQSSAESEMCTDRPDAPDGRAVVIGGKEYTIALDPAKIAENATTLQAGETTSTAGVVPGGLDVTPDGAASYSIPIKVPTGRAGIQPTLALVYNSRAGMDTAGVGWSLSGLPEIRVCPTNLRHDAQNKPVKFDGNDPLCLNGQRLIEVTGLSNDPNSFIAPLAMGEKEYRTERSDGSRIIGRGMEGGVPTYFEVAARDGRILKYGRYPGYTGADALSSSRLGRPWLYAERFIEGPRPPDANPDDPPPSLPNPNRKLVTASWPLTQVTDRWGASNSEPGNRLDVVYRVIESGYDEDNMVLYEHFPEEIWYTGFGANRGARAVKFTYQISATGADRSDAWFAGTNRQRTRLLKRITTYAPDGKSTDPRPVQYYKLNHTASPSTRRSLLQSVTICAPGTDRTSDDDDVCQQGSTFGYEPGSLKFRKMDTGIQDALQAGDANKAPAETDHAWLGTGDFNGDGFGDIIYAFKDAQGQRKHKYLISNYSGTGADPFIVPAGSTGIFDSSAGYAPAIRQRVNVSAPYWSKAEPPAMSQPWFSDLDGDGKPELVFSGVVPRAVES